MKVIKAIFEKNMLITLLMGFSSGLPLLLTGKTLQVWMTEQEVDLKTIGLFALVGLPYSLKFVWAPLFDRYTLPFLGRRRGWLLLNQLALAGAIGAMAMMQPKEHLWWVAALCLVVSFFSASQDIVVDAFRRESLRDEQLGMGSTLYIYGYRVAMYAAGAGALYFAQFLSWKMAYLIMAAGVSIGLITTLFADEPKNELPPPKNLQQAVIEPFKEFLGRAGAFEILLFILLYKIGDTMAGAMANPFYVQLGFSKAEIATIAKTFGLFSALGGGFVAGLVLIKVGIVRGLWIFGFLQAASTAGFAVLANIGYSLSGLTWVIAFEDFTGAMGTAAYAAYLASQTDKRFTATQYALLTSLMALPRTFLAAPTGWMAETMGWNSFFLFCTVAAVPGMLLLLRVAPWQSKETKPSLAH
jgi:MFS transporter, PAT family, beta-lactamase induction signal transducer AmpG